MEENHQNLKIDYHQPIRVVWYLKEEGLIDSELSVGFKYVYGISSSIIHGNFPSSESIEKVKELAPFLFEELNEILDEVYP